MINEYPCASCQAERGRKTKQSIWKFKQRLLVAHFGRCFVVLFFFFSKSHVYGGFAQGTNSRYDKQINNQNQPEYNQTEIQIERRNYMDGNAS